MQVDYIVVGQGICGTLFSNYLLQSGKTVLVIDRYNPASASYTASGVINPVTGRRIVRTWMIEELLPFALDAYTQLGQQLQKKFISHCNVLDFHPTPQMRDAFAERMPDEAAYLTIPENADDWQQYFRYNYGVGEIQPCLLIDLHKLLHSYRQYLLQQNALLDEQFDWQHCTVTQEQVTYKNISAKNIICCEGVAGTENPYFNRLPYATNKGEALIVSIPGLPRQHIYKQGISIVPWQEDLFWIGSTYEWSYTNLLPSASFRNKTEEQLRYWLKLPFTTIDHIAAERPANIERRPFAGFHPVHTSVGVLNGMGTKGCSLAPYFAQQLAQHLTTGETILPQADIKRFTRILSQ